MSKIILDEAMRVKLSGLSGPVEVCAQDGKIIGLFVPQDEFTRSVYDWAKAEVTDEELDRVKLENGGRTLAEIKNRLGWK